jgi:hypothetical protein
MGACDVHRSSVTRGPSSPRGGTSFACCCEFIRSLGAVVGFQPMRNGPPSHREDGPFYNHSRTTALTHSRTLHRDSRAPRLPNHVPSPGSKSLVLGKSAMASEPCIQPTSATSDATSTVNDASRNADQRSLSTAMSR